MPKISLTIHTASHDDFLESQGIPSAAAMVVDNLNHQEFREFELVYVDAHHAENAAHVASLRAEFPVKHVPIHPAHRYWMDQGHIYIAAAKNTGLLHADGELVVSCDDAEVFPPNFLAEYWRYWKEEGRFLVAFHRRYKNIKVKDGLPVHPLEGEIYVNDSRGIAIEKTGTDVIRREEGDWCYAGTSCSLEMAIAINGHMEHADGQKALEDVTFGTQMQKAGAKFAIDRNVWLGIIEHAATYMDPQEKRTNFTAVENYGLISCIREIEGFHVANRPNQITEAALAILQRDTLRFRKWDPLGPEHAADLKRWMALPPFDIKKQRDIIRSESSLPPSSTLIALDDAAAMMQKVGEIISTWHQAKIDGWCNEGKARSLTQIILTHRPAIAVEIGVHAGSSLIPQALAMKAAGAGLVHGIDAWHKDSSLVGVKNPENIKFWSALDYDIKHQEAIRHIDELEVGAYANLIHEPSDKAVSRFADGTVGLLHLNGNPASALNDAKLYLPKVADGGFIFVCDTDWSEGGTFIVQPAIKFLTNSGCRLIEHAGNVAVLMKPGAVVSQPVAAVVPKSIQTNAVQRTTGSINDFFDKVFCINLAARTDRWSQFQQMCQTHNIEVERFEGYVGELNGKRHGMHGAMLSHRALLGIIAHYGWSRVLIMEDDAKAVYGVDLQDQFARQIAMVPNDFDVVYLGGLYDENPLSRINEAVLRVGKMSGLHAYGVTSKFAREFFPHMQGAPDACISTQSRDRRYYCLQDRLFVQSAGYSDIQSKETNYEHYGVDRRHQDTV